MDPEIEAVDDGEPIEGAEDDASSSTDEGTPDGTEVEASGETPGDDDDEVTVSIGDEEPPSDETQDAPKWVRDLRKDHQQTKRELREAKAENDRLKAANQPAAVELGAKPTLEACAYDEERYERDLEAWQERKRKADDQVREQEEAKKAADKAWADRLAAYGTAKSTMKVKDFDEAESAVLTAFDVTQQGILIHSKQPEVMIYALGKNTAAREELAKIKIPVEFAIAVGRLESKLKVTPRKTVPPPERRINGNAPGKGAMGGEDATLTRLRAEADKSGDRTKVVAYLRQKNKAAAAA